MEEPLETISAVSSCNSGSLNSALLSSQQFGFYGNTFIPIPTSSGEYYSGIEPITTNAECSSTMTNAVSLIQNASFTKSGGCVVRSTMVGLDTSSIEPVTPKATGTLVAAASQFDHSSSSGSWRSEIGQ